MVMASVARLKFWITARCSSLSKPRSVHHSVGITPVKPPMPPITPPAAPAMPSATRPPTPICGSRRAISITGHHSVRKAPSTALNHCASSSGSTATPSGIPATPPATNGHRRRHDRPRRTDAAASNWPVSAPNTVIAAASRGSIAQAQNDIATMPKAKPDRPWTKPATAAPAMTISKVESKGTRKDARVWRCRAHNYALPCPRCQPSFLLQCANLIRCFSSDLILFRLPWVRYDLRIGNGLRGATTVARAGRCGDMSPGCHRA
ncbi:protein of unknown function [Cupriavidus taiwanensis]|nr:protein of unknown function [Cupriavidus taiwanensis]